jgi:hypothetical protein
VKHTKKPVVDLHGTKDTTTKVVGPLMQKPHGLQHAVGEAHLAPADAKCKSKKVVGI